jgi:CheY-like chemotaxis protein
VRITVADNGPGIPPHLRARVFEPYFTTKPTGIGTGVGLAVSLGIVEAHGGELTVECPEEGGAAFSVAIPVASVAATVVPTWPPQLASPKRRSVLVVDDESELRETLASILSSARQRVVTVGSGHEALERLSVDNFDAILTDVRMPGLDGRALYHEIVRRWPSRGGRVAFVTGDTLSAALNQFVAESGRPVIHKPFMPDEVRRVVEELAAVGEASAPAKAPEAG